MAIYIATLFGKTGQLPLSGLGAPLLSRTGSGLLTWIPALAWVAAEPAPIPQRRARAVASSEAPIAGGTLVQAVLCACLATGFARVVWNALLDREGIVTSAVLTRHLDSERIRPVYNPRLLRIARAVGGPTLVDRHGVVLAATVGGQRRVLAPWMAAVVGVAGDLTPLPGTLEDQIAHKYRRFPYVASGFTEISLCGPDGCASGTGARDGAAVDLQDASGSQPIDVLDLRAAWSPEADTPADAIEHAARVAPSPRVRTTHDAMLTAAIGTLLKDAAGAAGAPVALAAVVDAHSGEILVEASSAGFDPYTLTDDGLQAASNSYSPERNLARRLALPPGSSVKPFLYARWLDTVATRSPLVCLAHPGEGAMGSVYVAADRGGRWFHDFAREAPHGRPSVAKAIEVSCNCAAITAAEDLGAEALASLYAELGFTRPTVGPSGPDLAAAAIGQGTVLASVVDAAYAIALFGDDGALARCDTLREQGQPLSCTRQQVASPTAIASVRAGLLGAVTGDEGTARKAEPMPSDGFQIIGKTGTSQSPAFSDETSPAADNAWFVGLIEANGHSYAVAVLVPRGGFGGQAAAPVAKQIGVLLREFGYLSDDLGDSSERRGVPKAKVAQGT